MLKKISNLFAFSMLSQVILFVFYPIMTRIYSPQEFGYYAAVSAAAMIIASVSMLRYDFALYYEADEDHQKRILVISLVICLIISFISTGLGFIYDQNWGMSLGILVFAISMQSLLNVYFVKNNLNGAINQSKIIYAVVFSGLQIGLGTLNPSGLVMVWSDGIARLVSSYRLLGLLFVFPQQKAKNMEMYQQLLRKYFYLVKYTSVSSLINTISGSVITLFLNHFYQPNQAGLYALSQRVIQGPLGMLTYSINQTYNGDLSNKESMEDQGKTIKKFSLVMLLLGLLVGVLIYSIAPVIPRFLGAEWQETSRVIQLLCPFFGAAFAVSPLMNSLNLLKLNHMQMYYEIFRFISVVLVLAYIYFYRVDFYDGVGIYSWIMFSLYVIYMVLIYVILRGGDGLEKK